MTTAPVRPPDPAPQADPPSPGPVVTVTRAPGGIVVRWFADVAAARGGYPFLTASRERVHVQLDLTEPADLPRVADHIATGWKVRDDLLAGRDEQVLALATHRRRFLGVEVTPVAVPA